LPTKTGVNQMAGCVSLIPSITFAQVLNTLHE
jgi:hypothetical protein